MIKQDLHQFGGMQQDIKNPEVNAKFLYEGHNIRITSNGDRSLLHITNEKGNKMLSADIKGLYLGHSVINNYLVLFTTEIKLVGVLDNSNPSNLNHKILKQSGKDYIYRIDLTDLESIRTESLFSGKLNFSVNHPIETLGIFENDSIQKVYWTDGLNQPRVINIVADKTKFKKTSFDFVPTLNLDETVSIRKINASNGKFHSGIVQYAFTYWNKYGQESNIFYTSELHYISPKDRGASPEETVDNSFEITINNVDPTFEYIRVYSIIRTSLDAVPEVKIVDDVLLNHLLVQGNVAINNSKETHITNPRLYNKWEDVSIVLLFQANDYETSGEYYTTIIPIQDIYKAYTQEGIIEDGGLNMLDKVVEFDPQIGQSGPFLKLNYEDFSKYNDGTPKILIKDGENRIITFGTASTLYLSILQYYNGDGDPTHPMLLTDKNLNNSDSIIVGTGYALTNSYVPSYIIIDNNLGELVDPTYLLYVGGEDILSNTMTHKDGTLFFGNVQLTRPSIEEQIKSSLLLDPKNKVVKNHINIKESYRTITSDISIQGSYYNYHNSLDTSYSAGFKAGEYYRLGLQFQYKNGKWSEPVYLGDYQVSDSIRPNITEKYGEIETQIPKLSYTLDNSIIKKLLELNFVKVRPVVVFPSMADRRIITQGVLCPTVFNIKDRAGNAPFAQSSWFFRAYHPRALGARNIKFNNTAIYSKYGTFVEYRHLYGLPMGATFSAEIQSSYYAKFSEMYYNLSDVQKPISGVDGVTRYPNIPNEFGAMYMVDQSILTMHSPEVEISGDFNDFKFTDNVQLRIIGSAPFMSNIGHINIQTSSASKYGTEGFTPYYTGVSNKEINLSSTEYLYSRSLVSNLYYEDCIVSAEEKNDKTILKEDGGYKWLIYPWHRSGSLNNDYNRPAEFGARLSVLKKKVMSNLKFSKGTTWYKSEDYWSPTEGITVPQIFSSNEISLGRISYKNNILPEVNYYGNIDSIATVGDAYPFALVRDGNDHIESTIEWEDLDDYITDLSTAKEPSRIKYKSTPHIFFGIQYKIDNNDNVIQEILPNLNDINNEDTSNDDNVNEEDKYKIPYWFTSLSAEVVPEQYLTYIQANNGLITDTKIFDGIDMEGGEYFILENSDATNKYTLCQYNQKDVNGAHHYQKISLSGNDVNTVYFVNLKDGNPINPPEYFRPTYNGTEYTLQPLKPPTTTAPTHTYTIKQETIQNDHIDIYADANYPHLPTLFIAEIIRPDQPKDLFGGNTMESIERNVWIPANTATKLINTKGGISVEYVYGDTWYQRYDCLKTYPFTHEDENQVVEIASFMCETRTNIDGRYDKNRGQLSNLNANPQNFNLWNSVYNQKDNFFKYRILDLDFYKLNRFPNVITWTKEKSNGSKIDAWTNVTMASTLDLDGDKGEITSLNTFGNEIFCFQEKGLSNIIFNAREQVSTASGVPIEITNGYKVSGKRYISNIGCNNKWSIAESPSGLYFIDNRTRGIYLFDGKSVVSLSSNLGMSDYIRSYSNMNSWIPGNYSKMLNPKDTNNPFNNFKASYDSTNNNIYFTNSNHSLCYSEVLGQFESFLDYPNTFSFINVGSNTVAIYSGEPSSDGKIGTAFDTVLYKQNAIDNTNIYGNDKEYSLTVISNAEPVLDKIYSNIEFRGDSFGKDDEGKTKFLPITCPFNKIKVWNEYQNTGDIDLSFIKGRPSNLKQKFRIWRINVPRDGENKRDRIRNPWAYIKLSGNSSNKIELHDLIVNYVI